MNRIALDIDVYGKYARLSAVADWLERLAAGGVLVTESGLADFLTDSGWRFPDHWMTGEEEGTEDGKELDVGRANARSVFGLLEERSETLGPKYPFAVGENRLALAPGADLLIDAYAAAWALTICHAYGLAAPHPPTQVFEDTVAAVMRSDRMLAVNFGQTRRAHSGFAAALHAAGDQLKLPVDPEGAIRSKSAQDENVDTICHVPWGDRRPGLWGYIGQATCARSDDWEGKMLEPRPAPWMSWLGTTVEPVAFLAVPHHVEPKHMARLVEGGQRIVIDRLRLTWVKTEVSEYEKAIIQTVMDAECDVP